MKQIIANGKPVAVKPCADLPLPGITTVMRGKELIRKLGYEPAWKDWDTVLTT